MTPIRIALIEDDELLRTVLRHTLAGEQCQWAGDAADGQSGLVLVTETQPDVAIIDLGLPDMSGIEIAQKIKAAPGDRPCRVLILTLNNSVESVLAAFAAGADAYCMKASRPALLLEAIQSVAEGFAWIDPAIARVVLSQSPPSPQPAPAAPKVVPDHKLTDRELQVLQLIVDGYSNAEIAAQLYITVGTAKTHVRNILNKLSADDRTQAAVRALRAGLVG